MRAVLATLKTLRERKPFGWWDAFNEVLYRNPEDAREAREGGNSVFCLYHVED